MSTLEAANSQSTENKEEEWPYFKYENSAQQLKEFANAVLPFLIMELHRLQPYYYDNYRRVHVLHMPQLKIEMVEIIGVIRKVCKRSKLDLYVDDGTGQVGVLVEWEEISKLKEKRKVIDDKYQRLEKIAEIKNNKKEQMPILEKGWMQETNNGRLGTDFKVLEYINVTGRICLDFGYTEPPAKDVCLDKAHFYKPLLRAKSIRHLTEKEYNDKMHSWILGIVKHRYHED